jgi:hypothetical protein
MIAFTSADDAAAVWNYKWRRTMKAIDLCAMAYIIELLVQQRLGDKSAPRGRIRAEGIAGGGAQELIEKLLDDRKIKGGFDLAISDATNPVTASFPRDVVPNFGIHTGKRVVLDETPLIKHRPNSNGPPQISTTEILEPGIVESHVLESYIKVYDSSSTYPATGKFGGRPTSSLDAIKAKEQKAIKNLRSAFAKPVSEAEEALNKDPRGWTADEAELVRQLYLDTQGSPDTRAIDGLRERHRAHNTPDDLYPSTYDQQVAKTPSPAVAARGGMDLTRAMDFLGAGIGRQAETHGLASVVRWLQRGLDFIEPSDVGPDGEPPLSFTGGGLKKDGIPGPKTIGATRRAVVAVGSHKVRQAARVGRFDEILRRPPLTPETVDEAAQVLFGGHGASVGADGPARLLQVGINGFGRETLKSHWRRIAIDGVIGPKTVTSLGWLDRVAGPGAVARNLGKEFNVI